MNNMIIKTHKQNLYISDREKINNLIDICNKFDNTKINIDLDDNESIFFISYSENEICALSVLYKINDSCFDASFITHPEYRRQGLFKDLLNYVKDYLSSSDITPNLSFMVDINNNTAKLIMEKIGANYISTDYMMSYNVNSIKNFNISNIELKNIDSGHCLIYSNKTKVGYFNISYFGNVAYFYHLKIFKKYRNNHYAINAIKLLISCLKKKNIYSISLQVSKSNIPAYNLYKKIGFIVDSGVDNYILNIKKDENL